MIEPALYTSRTEEWETPPDLFAKLDAIYDFRLDACASPGNAKCAHYFTKADDALSRDWSPFGRVWLNPPYGRAIVGWMRKAYTEARKGALVVCLLPARTDTRWWHAWVAGKSDTVFLRGRLKYLNAQHQKQHSAPFPSVLVIYQPDLDLVCNHGVEFTEPAR